MPFNLPIALTWLRVAAIPLLVGIFYLPSSWLSIEEKNVFATALFVFAAITDWLDGFLARRKLCCISFLRVKAQRDQDFS